MHERVASREVEVGAISDINVRMPQSMPLPIGCRTYTIMLKDLTLVTPGHMGRSAHGARRRGQAAMSHTRAAHPQGLAGTRGERRSGEERVMDEAMPHASEMATCRH